MHQDSAPIMACRLDEMTKTEEAIGTVFNPQ